MRHYRPQKVGSLIRVELNKILLKEMETPGALVTITDIQVTDDLEHAVVGVSVWPSEKSEEVFKLLEKRRRQIQFLLTRTLNIKPMPQIVFKIDRGPEKAAEVEKALLNK